MLVHDSSGREDEVDMVLAAHAATPEMIRTMRKDGGGLICLALGGDISKSLGIPFMADMLESFGGKIGRMVPKKTAYGDRPAFSIPVNHRDTFTGITDKDRSKTIMGFADRMSAGEFQKRYYAPGHVHLLIASDISQRRGHTELSCELAKRAGLPEAMVLCEMMSDDGGALSVEEAKRYGNRMGFPLIDGASI